MKFYGYSWQIARKHSKAISKNPQGHHKSRISGAKLQEASYERSGSHLDSRDGFVPCSMKRRISFTSPNCTLYYMKAYRIYIA